MRVVQKDQAAEHHSFAAHATLGACRMFEPMPVGNVESPLISRTVEDPSLC